MPSDEILDLDFDQLESDIEDAFDIDEIVEVVE